MALSPGDKVLILQGADGKAVAFGPLVSPANGDPVVMMHAADGKAVAAALGGGGGQPTGICECGPPMLLTISGMISAEKWQFWGNGVHVICPALYRVWKRRNGTNVTRRQEWDIGRIRKERNWDELGFIWRRYKTSSATNRRQIARVEIRKATRKNVFGTTPGNPSVSQWQHIANSGTLGGVRTATFTDTPLQVPSAYPWTNNQTAADMAGFFQSVTVVSNFANMGNHNVNFSWQVYNIDQWRLTGRDRTTWNVASTYTNSTNYDYRYTCFPDGQFADLRPLY